MAIGFPWRRHSSEVSILTEGKRVGQLADVGEFGVCHQAKEEFLLRAVLCCVQGERSCLERERRFRWDLARGVRHI